MLEVLWQYRAREGGRVGDAEEIPCLGPRDEMVYACVFKHSMEPLGEQE